MRTRKPDAEPRDPNRVVGIKRHLPWDLPASAEAGEAVEALMASPGWERLMESLELYLRDQQTQLMRSTPSPEAVQHERIIGTWAGLQKVRALAVGIVEHGREAQNKLTNRAAEAA